MAQPDHSFPVVVDAEDDEECDQVEDHDVCIEKASRDITNGEHTQDVPFLGIDFPQVVDDVDRDEDTARENGNTGEEGTHEAQKPQEGNSIETDLVKQLRLFGMYEWRQPAKKGVGYAGWRFCTFVVLDLWLVNDLERVERDLSASCWKTGSSRPATNTPCPHTHSKGSVPCFLDEES